MSENPPDPFHGCDSCRYWALEAVHNRAMYEVERDFAKKTRDLDAKFARRTLWLWLFIVSGQSLAVGGYLGRGEYGNAVSLLCWIAAGHATGFGIPWLWRRQRRLPKPIDVKKTFRAHLARLSKR